VKVILIVVIPVESLLSLLVIFCSFRRYNISIKKRSTTAFNNTHRAAAEADSRMRFEIGSGQPGKVAFRSELTSSGLFESGPNTKTFTPFGVNEMASNTPELNTMYHNPTMHAPSSYPKSPSSPTIPGKPITSGISSNEPDY
jgi:hypothetical protein